MSGVALSDINMYSENDYQDVAQPRKNGSHIECIANGTITDATKSAAQGCVVISIVSRARQSSRGQKLRFSKACSFVSAPGEGASQLGLLALPDQVQSGLHGGPTVAEQAEPLMAQAEPCAAVLSSKAPHMLKGDTVAVGFRDLTCPSPNKQFMVPR